MSRKPVNADDFGLGLVGSGISSASGRRSNPVKATAKRPSSASSDRVCIICHPELSDIQSLVWELSELSDSAIKP